jgi:hypothetical protein
LPLLLFLLLPRHTATAKPALHLWVIIYIPLVHCTALMLLLLLLLQLVHYICSLLLANFSNALKLKVTHSCPHC